MVGWRQIPHGSEESSVSTLQFNDILKYSCCWWSRITNGIMVTIRTMVWPLLDCKDLHEPVSTGKHLTHLPHTRRIQVQFPVHTSVHSQLPRNELSETQYLLLAPGSTCTQMHQVTPRPAYINMITNSTSCWILPRSNPVPKRKQRNLPESLRHTSWAQL